MEKSYVPHKCYQEYDFLEGGAFWERQHHVFENPLYYLDYTIAQVVSLEFFSESVKDHKKAFEKYIAFDRLGGKYSFRKLLEKAGIANPFDGDTLKNVAEDVMSYLSKFNPNELDK